MPYKYPSQMRLTGREEGREEGREAGREEGRLQGMVYVLLLVVDSRGIELSQADRERIASCSDPELLCSWLERAVTADDAETLFRPV
ncbi:hypothetical protein [Glycomyces xiaoerkulensis]|uniref:hypothetical protein n=1 Tax=Glycomyces xiaoerkulensis TaxID=2038139 RepID=UPI000C256CB9|nr:hypothetical protein [Glycomyces xiaoerkulensis]